MDEVAEVKSRLEIAEVVGPYVPLKQAGRNLKAPCPFHQEKTASFMVSPEKGIYHCFGCSEGGDMFNFVMKMEGVEFREALEILARKAGVELQERKSDGGAAKRLRERLQEAHTLAVRYFQASLAANKAAIEYVAKKRGLTRETVKEFGIGYAPDSWDALTGFLLKQGFTSKELLQAGLAGQKPGRNSIYDLFRGRIMFPIGDREGRPIAFTGRVLDDGEPKYLNTPQTPLFDKSQTIFGWHLAREAIRTANEVVLVEGQMDVVASHQAGVRRVVATSGTALTLEHLRNLSKLTKNVKLAFDSDRAGLAATERAIELGQTLGLSLRMVELPAGFKDADELIKKDVAAWERAIVEAKYIVDYLFDRFERDYDLSSGVGKRGYTDRLVANLRRLGDPVEQDHYVKLLAEKAGASEEAVRAKLARTAGPGAAELSSRGSQAEAGSMRLGGSFVPPAGAVNSEQPVRRALTQSPGKPTGRAQKEQLFLGLNLIYEFSRDSLDDLAPERFSSDLTRQIYRILFDNRDKSFKDILSASPDYSTDLLRLQLIVENYSFDSEMELKTGVFELAKSIFKESNVDFIRALHGEIARAQDSGDQKLVMELVERVNKLIKAESRYFV